MKAYNNDKKLKADLVAEALKHQKADEIIQGTYGDEDGWCAVGCTIKSYNDKRGKTFNTNDHSMYETELGIPRMLARLEDRLFEGMDLKDAKGFPVKFLRAVNVGADLSMVWTKFIIWLLIDEKDGVIKFASPKGEVAIKNVAKLYLRKLAGDEPTRDEWRVAAAAAADADAADAAADAAAAYAYAADADAADAAAYAYAAYAADARETHYKTMANKLLEILRGSK